MCVAMTIGKIQAKSRFTLAEGESRKSPMAEGRTLVFNKNNVQGKVA